MTTTVEPLLPPAPPSAYERWRKRLSTDTRLRRLSGWLAPLLVTALAGFLRLFNLGHPHALVFDETYYVKDAWSQWILGYAATWPEKANELFTSGQTDVFTTDPSYVVHPPLGKFLIGAGMALFGPESSFGWRIAAALTGTACVLVLYFLAKSLVPSIVFATVASGLMAIDGTAIVLSRVALLDIFLTFFVLLAVWFTVLDRRTHLDRLAELTRARIHDDGPPRWGPVRWNRPWIVAAGAAAGAACGVKWSGVWVLAALGIYVVVTDALERRRLGIQFWPVDAVRQGAASFLLLVPVAFVLYLASWSSWLLTDGGYARHEADAHPETGLWSWVPLSLQSLWRYHETIYTSMAGMSTAHSYMSPAWAWPFLWRPTAMYSASIPDGQDGCASAQGCLQILYSMPNPLLWYAAIAATAWLAYRFVVVRDWRYAVVLTAIGSTWLPWLLFPERTVFQFYTIALTPFLLLALTFALREIAAPPGGSPARRLAGRRVVLVVLAVAVVLSAFWYPLWSGMQVPYEFYRLHNWMPGWV